MSLGIDSLRDRFCTEFAELGERARVVLTAPTGSGKSTRVPLWCWLATKKPVLVIEPRRVAAKTLAEWVASGLKADSGRVGYSVRFESRRAEEASILFVTPGVCRRFLVEGSLERFGTVIFDEFHERSWETDALLALMAANPLHPRLVVMSATLTADQLCRRYGGKLFECHDRAFPVETVYWGGLREDITMPSSRRLVERTIAAVQQEWKAQAEGSLLVFLPGLQSMKEVASGLGRIPTVLLHGAFSSQEQERAFDQSFRKVVLATNVAESSLTIPDISVVVDSGLERRQVHQSGYVALSTVAIAASSAQQRAGRAGRVRSGRCVRLWAETAKLEPTRPPDICRMEVDELLLFLSALPQGLASPAEWLETPPDFAWERARVRLTANGLLDDSGRLTELGRRAEKLPVEQDWARVILSAPTELRADLCDLCALAGSRRSPLRNTASEEILKARKNDWGDDPWNQALGSIRLGETVRHGLDPDGMEMVRKVSTELKAASGASDVKGSKPHLRLREYLAGIWPSRFFVLREGREAWGNGQVECRLPRGEGVPDDCLAAFFLQVQPVMGRGLKVDLQGRWGLPVRLSLLREAGLGSPKLSKIRWLEGRVKARVTWLYAGREIAGSEEELSGRSLREALVELAAQGGWGHESLKAIEEERFYAHLSVALEGGEIDVVSANELMKIRLERLGVEQVEDLELLGSHDLVESTMAAWELEKLRGDYPRIYSIGGASFEMEYHPRQRLVLMNSLAHAKGVKVNPQHLPRWNGWKVELNERGRRTSLR